MPKITFSGNEKSTPTFIGDFLSRDYLLPGGVKVDPAGFNAYDAVVVTVGGGGAAQGATSIPVSALSGAIPSGTVLRFSADEFATLSSAAAAGATSLSVEALVNALESGDKATYPGTSNKKRVVGGTIIGRTYAERDAGTAFGLAADADDEVFIVAYDIYDVAEIADAEVLRDGTLIKENFLPGWTGVSATLKGKIRAKYETTLGAGGAG